MLLVLADTTQLGKLFHVGLFTTLLVNPNFHRSYFASVVCWTVTLRPNQSLFATRFANWRFHCQISQICRFSKTDGSENYRFILNSEKHLVTVFVTSSKFRK